LLWGPLGGLSTGCLDIDARGVTGFSSLFNPIGYEDLAARSRQPRRLPDVQPLLGLSIGGKTWVLASQEMVAGEQSPGAPSRGCPVESMFGAVAQTTSRCSRWKGLRPPG